MIPGAAGGDSQPDPVTRVIYVVGGAGGFPSLIGSVLGAERKRRVFLVEVHGFSPGPELFSCHGLVVPAIIGQSEDTPKWRVNCRFCRGSKHNLARLRKIWPFSRAMARHFSRRAIT